MVGWIQKNIVAKKSINFFFLSSANLSIVRIL